MRKRIIATLGFSTDPVFKLLAAVPLDRQTEIFLIAPQTTSPGTARALGTVRAHLGDRVASVELATLPNKPLEALAVLADIMAPDAEYIVSPSGGMRYLVTLVTVATIVFRPEADIVVISESGEVEDLRIDKRVIKLLKEGLGVTEEALLAELAKGRLSEKEAAENLGKSLKTIKNAVGRLRKLGLVRRVGRGGRLEITSEGLAALKIVEIIRQRQQPSRGK